MYGGDKKPRERKRTCCEGFCGFLFAAGLFVLIYWAVFQPHQIRATVVSATLSNLTVISNNASSSPEVVSYSLAVSLSVYNPSKRVNIYYDTVGAELRFRDAAIGPAATGASPSEFYQRRKASHDVKLDFDYVRSGVAVGRDVAGELETAAKSGGPLSLELGVDVRVRYVFRIFKLRLKLRQKPRIWCSLSIPVKAEARGSGFGGAVASGDRCRVKY
ncbi:unnamed protein product [Urochloa decumbens]|uniref:Late embryogenesis abundant protein LEA-2 subgroup domain-containing protein n=1 Tax=Urochloa decumbens TaxID=240449 RepID=A0ABC8WLB4_9POAL